MNFVTSSSIYKFPDFGQQSVTGVEQKDDVHSHWVVETATNKNCDRGQPLRCGDIRHLENLTTKKNLHSLANIRTNGRGGHEATAIRHSMGYS